MEENKNLTKHSNQRLQSGTHNLVVSDNKLVIQNELPNEDIRRLIYTIRGKQVMLDSDVAMLYNYQTKRINETVSRNKERFPENFCFQLTEEEVKNLKRQSTIQNLTHENNWSQFATSSKKANKKILIIDKIVF